MFIESLSAPIEFLTISIEFNVLQLISSDFHGLPLISGGLLWVNVGLVGFVYKDPVGKCTQRSVHYKDLSVFSHPHDAEKIHVRFLQVSPIFGRGCRYTMQTDLHSRMNLSEFISRWKHSATPSGAKSICHTNECAAAPKRCINMEGNSSRNNPTRMHCTAPVHGRRQYFSACSLDHFCELFRDECRHGVLGRLCRKFAWLFGERVETLKRWHCGFDHL